MGSGEPTGDRPQPSIASNRAGSWRQRWSPPTGPGLEVWKTPLTFSGRSHTQIYREASKKAPQSVRVSVRGGPGSHGASSLGHCRLLLCWRLGWPVGPSTPDLWQVSGPHAWDSVCGLWTPPSPSAKHRPHLGGGGDYRLLASGGAVRHLDQCRWKMSQPWLGCRAHRAHRAPLASSG